MLGLSWFEHFRLHIRKFTAIATRLEVEGFRGQGFVLPKVEIRVQNFVASNVCPQERSQTSVYHSQIARCTFILAHLVHIISLKQDSMLNTCSNDFIGGYSYHWSTLI